MHAILHRQDGGTRLTVGDLDPGAVEGAVVASSEIGFDAEAVYDFLADTTIGNASAPTIEEVTAAFDPWLAWYGGSDGGCHAVLYGRRGAHDRRVHFRSVGDGYEVALQLGTVASVPENEFEPADDAPVVVTTGSVLHAKRAFHDLCAVA